MVQQILTEVASALVLLDAQAGVRALMESGVGTMIQFGLLLMAVLLSVGSLFAIGAAGMSRMSQDAGRQGDVAKYAATAAIMLACAAVLGAGPEILSALGFQTMDYISPINVFTG
jgi:hypothetical protein